MNTPSPSTSPELTWFKSSHSSDQGGACVEVAYDWRKSRRSGSEGDACVEVAALPAVVLVRDSKDPEGPRIAVGAATWGAFTGFVRKG
ncbi:DUF397 domain-containing protein [Streptomyces sp. MST-110588]|nr:DUF397 domain-containing protein [Streptomyces sp. MST-110588]